MVSSATRAECPICGRLVKLRRMDASGDPMMNWHLQQNWRRCEGSNRSLREAAATHREAAAKAVQNG